MRGEVQALSAQECSDKINTDTISSRMLATVAISDVYITIDKRAVNARCLNLYYIHMHAVEFLQNPVEALRIVKTNN